MFERYTEKARRVIFFARYEASQFGSPYIETEHLLLGLLREPTPVARLLERYGLRLEDLRNQLAQAPKERDLQATYRDAVAELLSAFDSACQRLRPEIEPAVGYTIVPLVPPGSET